MPFPFLQAANDLGGVAELRVRISDEEERRCQWKKENVRRRHNYLPFIVEMLKSLGESGQLMDVYSRARDKAETLEANKKEKKGKE